MVLSWFNADEEKKFGESLARFFMERTSVDSHRPGKVVAKKQDELLNKMTQQVVQFRQQRKLNIYKKAQLGNAFKWTLRDAGVDPAYADELTTWLMLRC
jgi:hypothetical protein